MTGLVFVSVNAKDCGPCIMYEKNIRDPLIAKIEKENGVDIVEINNERRSASLDSFHPMLKHWVGWFPTFLIFTKETWEDKESNLLGTIYDGKFNEQGKPEWIKGTLATEKNILEWIHVIKNYEVSLSRSKKYDSPLSCIDDEQLLQKFKKFIVEIKFEESKEFLSITQ